MYLLLLFCLGVVAGWLGSLLAIRFGVKDVPNARSSHVSVTPRGGGSAFVGVGFIAAMMLAYGTLSTAGVWLVLGYALPVLVIAGTGLADDIYDLSARFRLVVQFICVLVMLGLSWTFLHLSEIPIVFLGLGCIASVWVINAYNFMDGIDGIASLQALVVLGLGGWAFHSEGQSFLALFCLFLAAPILGFLFANWPPARIFMGDVGSGALGALFALLVIVSASFAPRASIVLVIALAPFLVDATLTLIRRLVAGARPSEAHREHLYQKMTQRSGSHLKTLLIWGAANLAIVVPACALVLLNKIDPVMGLGAVYLGLALVYVGVIRYVSVGT